MRTIGLALAASWHVAAAGASTTPASGTVPLPCDGCQQISHSDLTAGVDRIKEFEARLAGLSAAEATLAPWPHVFEVLVTPRVRVVRQDPGMLFGLAS